LANSSCVNNFISWSSWTKEISQQQLEIATYATNEPQ